MNKKTTGYQKWDIVLASLDPTVGAEIAKTHPVLIVSPEAVNRFMRTVTVIPLTSQPKGYPFRYPTVYEGRAGELCLDQIKSIDKSRIVKKKKPLEKQFQAEVNELLARYFSE